MDFKVLLVRRSDGEEIGGVIFPRLPSVGSIVDAPDGEIWEVLHVAAQDDDNNYWAVVQPFTF